MCVCVCGGGGGGGGEGKEKEGGKNLKYRFQDYVHMGHRFFHQH